VDVAAGFLSAGIGSQMLAASTSGLSPDLLCSYNLEMTIGIGALETADHSRIPG
jgi:hypothetical protein